MISIVCFGLAPEANVLTGITTAIPGLLIGIAVIIFLNKLIDAVTKSRQKEQHADYPANFIQLKDQL